MDDEPHARPQRQTEFLRRSAGQARRQVAAHRGEEDTMSTNEDMMARLDAWIEEANHKDIKFGLIKMKSARDRMLTEFRDGITELEAIDKPEPRRRASRRVERRDKGTRRVRNNNAEVMAVQLKEAP
jgi:hypothetical protein